MCARTLGVSVVLPLIGSGIKYPGKQAEGVGSRQQWQTLAGSTQRWCQSAALAEAVPAGYSKENPMGVFRVEVARPFPWLVSVWQLLPVL